MSNRHGADNTWTQRTQRTWREQLGAGGCSGDSSRRWPWARPCGQTKVASYRRRLRPRLLLFHDCRSRYQNIAKCFHVCLGNVIYCLCSTTIFVRNVCACNCIMQVYELELERQCEYLYLNVDHDLYLISSVIAIRNRSNSCEIQHLSTLTFAGILVISVERPNLLRRCR